MLHINPTWIRHDRTKRGWHVSVRLSKSLSPAEIVALQAVLGSDPRRESLNLMRVIFQRWERAPQRWNLLYREKLR